VNVRKSTTAATTSVPALPTPSPAPALLVAPPIPPKLLLAQQIHAIKECMTEEEHSMYLDACDMGKDFCAAGY
jgi:hypothetical protein